TNLDDDSAAIRITAAPDRRTREPGGTAKFTVVLATAPTDNVTIPLASRSMTEGRVSEPAGGSLTFTPMNWSIAQTVTVTGVDDMVADGNVPYAIRFTPATSGDMRYSQRTASDVFLTNIDDDSAGVTVTAAPNLTTSEAGGTPTTFTIVLNKAPTAGVSFVVRSSNTDEGTASPGAIQFSTENWNVPQTVTLTGVQDNLADGNQVYAIIIDSAQSSDTDYSNILVDPVIVTNLDDEMPAMLGKHRPAVRQQRTPASSHAR
ncbi:MAG: calcium-binding protein, partial [Polyangiaceae bacterium]